MAKLINDVLNAGEIEKIVEIEDDIRDAQSARILETVLHIDCSAPGQGVVVSTYTSLRSPYAHICRRAKRWPEGMPELPDEEKIRQRRAGHRAFGKRRHEILLDELRIRADDIRAHKWYVSEEEKKDVGLVRAAAHWLKDVSPAFYAKSESHHKEAGIQFEWGGMEKAVCIMAQSRQGKTSCYALVLPSDLMFEENIAQMAGGLPASMEWQKKCRDAREKLVEMYKTKYFCVLGGGKNGP